jgi:hypothetical protein
MGFFDRFKKKTKTVSEPENLENFPEMLVTKLLFEEKPMLDVDRISNELKSYFENFDHNRDLEATKSLIFKFPDIRVELLDAIGPAQCLVCVPSEDHPEPDIPETAFQQNWHWDEANSKAKKCRYKLLVTDLLTRTLDYKQRLNMYMNFLTAVVKATNPDVVYSGCGQKLIKPATLIENWDSDKKQVLNCICNVRLYNITGSGHRDLLMDTVGLNALGLPDFQVRFSDFKENEIANLLWNYAFYIYENGDIIETGNTLEGIISGSKWKCERKISPIQPERVIVDVQRD